SYGPLPTTLLENLVLATIALYVLATIRALLAVSAARDTAIRALLARLSRTPYGIGIVLLLLSGVISVFVAKDHRAALGLYRAYFIEPIVLFYVASDLLRRRADFRTLLMGLGIGTSIFAVMNVVVFAAAAFQNTIHFGAPPSAIYTSSNAVAMFLEPPAALAIGLVLFADERRDRRMALAWALILAVAFVLTFSRGGYLALAIFGVLTVIKVRPDLRRPLLIFGIVAAAAVLLTVVVASTTPLMKTRFSYVALNYTLQTRAAIFTATLGIIAAHPILGVGLGGYVYNLHGFPEIYPHDVYMTFWVELGLLGLLAFLYVFVRLGVSAWRALSLASGFEKALLWGVVGTVVTWAVHGIVDSPYWKNDMAVEFWLVVAIEVALVGALNIRLESKPRA
ncbi:MAG TPA: O-antigen ligase family protein, partial [Candidatus Dormibacteraeota bacterium]